MTISNQETLLKQLKSFVAKTRFPLYINTKCEAGRTGDGRYYCNFGGKENIYISAAATIFDVTFIFLQDENNKAFVDDIDSEELSLDNFYNPKQDFYAEMETKGNIGIGITGIQQYVVRNGEMKLYYHEPSSAVNEFLSLTN